MHARLRARAARAQIDLDLHATVAERLDLPDGSVDAVISSLVLCTVPDPAGVVSEVHRILRPRGDTPSWNTSPRRRALRCAACSGPCAGRGAGPSKAARASETCAP